jgi:hypothetical protein
MNKSYMSLEEREERLTKYVIAITSVNPLNVYVPQEFQNMKGECEMEIHEFTA